MNTSQGPKNIKRFSCSTQLSMKFIQLMNVIFILLINVKMPTVFGITTSMNGFDNLKLKILSILAILIFMSS